MKPGVAARLRAAEVVHRVVDEGAHSNVILDQETGLPALDRAAAHRLALDTLRWLPRTDAVLSSRLDRPLAEVDAMVRSVLRVGVTELGLGGEAYAVVDSAVEAVRAAGLGHASGFVNAVLRRVARDGPRDADDPALALGAPPWIRRRLVETWGADRADAFLAATLQPAPIGVRVRPGRSDGLLGEPVPGIPGARLVADRAQVVAAGASVVVMDPASTAVAAAVGAGPGHRVLDMAAAPGNKTTALWDAMGPDPMHGGVLVAADRHVARSRRAARRLASLGVGAAWVVADGRFPPFPEASFDRVLLDAPCTGLGTLRRRPEIKLTLDEDAPARMAVVQRHMLTAAVRLVQRGGSVVYSVCTVFPEETVDVVERFGGRPPDGFGGEIWGGGALLAPHLTGTDGMFISVIDR